MIQHLVFFPIMIMAAIAVMTMITTFITTFSIEFSQRRRKALADQATQESWRRGGFRPGVVQEGGVVRPVAKPIAKNTVVEPIRPDRRAEASEAEQDHPHRNLRRSGT